METDSFLYNRALLEKAFARCEKGTRSTEQGCQILLDRGEVELKYARALKEWAAKSKLIVDNEGFDTSKEIRQLYSGAIQEAEMMARLHQDMFYAFRDNDSPFERVYSIGHSRQSRDGKKIDVKKLTADFKKAKVQKRSLQDCESQWMRVRDRYIQELKKLAETDLSGEAARETKKDSLNAEIALLQEKIENAKKCLSSSSKKHEVFKERQTKVFSRMYTDLEAVERDRLATTVDAFKRLHRILNTTERIEWRSSVMDKIIELKRLVSAVRVEDILTQWQQQTEASLQSSFSRQTKSLMSILFDDNPALRERRQNFGSDLGPRRGSAQYRDVTALRYCESLACRKDPIRVRPGKRQQPPSGSLDKEQSLMGAFYSSGSSCESLVPAVTHNAPPAKVVNVTPAHQASEIMESTSVSSFDNPEKMVTVPVTPAAHLPPTRPGQFCAPPEDLCASGEESEGEECPTLSTSTDRVSLTDGILHQSGFGHDLNAVKPHDQTDVGNLKNTKVMAIRDHSSSEKDTLSFKRGQVIKQKVPQNDKGLCFGWTKSGRFSSKRYGFYPAECVSFYRKNA